MSIAGRHVLHHACTPWLARQAVVGRGDVGHLLAAAEHQVGERAGDEGLVRLDQHHVDLVVGQQAHVLGGGGAAVAAADHHDLGLGRACAVVAQPARPQQAEGGGGLQEGASLHGRVLPLLLRGEVAGQLLDLRVAVALGELVHDGRGPGAGLEGLAAARPGSSRGMPASAGTAEPGDRAAVGAVAVGAGGGQAAHVERVRRLGRAQRRRRASAAAARSGMRVSWVLLVVGATIRQRGRAAAKQFRGDEVRAARAGRGAGWKPNSQASSTAGNCAIASL